MGPNFDLERNMNIPRRVEFYSCCNEQTFTKLLLCSQQTSAGDVPLSIYGGLETDWHFVTSYYVSGLEYYRV